MCMVAGGIKGLIYMGRAPAIVSSTMMGLKTKSISYSTVVL